MWMICSFYWLIGIEGVVIRDDYAARVRVTLGCVLRRRVVACAREASSHIGEDLLELWLWLKDADRVSRCVARHLVLPPTKHVDVIRGSEKSCIVMLFRSSSRKTVAPKMYGLRWFKTCFFRFST